jgi:Ca2+/H+ antiporter, TMEM165/GDT1 family
MSTEEETSPRALVNSLAMIVVSEIGDKTFLLAAILAMRHPRVHVFAGAFGALFVMSILSAGLGHVLPALVPRAWTQLAAALLFIVFGTKMISEGRKMEGGNGKVQEEMREAEEEIAEDDAEASAIPLDNLEAGGPRSPGLKGGLREKKSLQSYADGARNFFAFCLGPVVVQSFVLTFLGEWGDRSQIATIALGAAHVRSCFLHFSPSINLAQNIWVVAFGTIAGHSLCTGAAVLGGRYIATKISAKHGQLLLPPNLAHFSSSLSLSTSVLSYLPYAETNPFLS